MRIVLITFSDDKFEPAKQRLVCQAEKTGVFDKIIPYSPSMVSKAIKDLPTWNIGRGCGLWTWKPDIIMQTIEKLEDGDIVVYADAGCSVYRSPEWDAIVKILNKFDIIAQRLYQRTDNWTRKELLDFFIDGNGKYWPKLYQYEATVILKVSDFTKKLIWEWLNLIIDHPEFVMDVTEEEKRSQHPCFIENRHDQAIYSALIYKYYLKPENKRKIYAMWEHIEEYDPFSKQAIRTTRLRDGKDETRQRRTKRMTKRLIKDFLMKPFYYAPMQYLYNYKNRKWLKKND